jgi:hypothetical protein
MNDRERAHVMLLRRLVELDRGPVDDLLAEAMDQLLVATAADLVYLAGGGLERHRATRSVDLEQLRVEIPTNPPRDALDPTRSIVCVPVFGLAFAGLVYVRTGGVLVASDVDLIELFARRVGTFAHVLARPEPDLHAETREFQYRRVLELLARNKTNVSQTARQLRVRRSFVYRLLSEFRAA